MSDSVPTADFVEPLTDDEYGGLPWDKPEPIFRPTLDRLIADRVARALGEAADRFLADHPWDDQKYSPLHVAEDLRDYADPDRHERHDRDLRDGGQ